MNNLNFLNETNESGTTPYISISNSKSDNSLQIISSHISFKSKNNNTENKNKNSNLFSSNSMIFNNQNNIINLTNSQISFDNNFSPLNSNKQEITKNSFFYSPSTICNYYQHSNESLISNSSKKNLINNINNIRINHNNNNNNNFNYNYLNNNNNNFNNFNNFNYNNNNNINNDYINNNNRTKIKLKKINIGNLNKDHLNNLDINSHSDNSVISDNISSRRKILIDKKTPIKYTKNQFKSTEKNRLNKSNKCKYKSKSISPQTNKDKKDINIFFFFKIRKNLMDTFDKIKNEYNIGNSRQLTEINLNNNNNNIKDFTKEINIFKQNYCISKVEEIFFNNKNNNKIKNKEINNKKKINSERKNLPINIIIKKYKKRN